MNTIEKLEKSYMKEELPEFKVGDVVDVRVKIKEGDKERIQTFNGTVIKIQGGKGISGSFTVRRIVQGEGVERVFPFHSPTVESVEVTRPGRVRRARLFYLRDRVGKATKVKERRIEVQPGARKRKSKAKRRAAAAAASES